MNILISKCLLGHPVRWHGKKLYKSTFVKKYEKIHNINWIPVCPELLGGLSVPRPPVKRKNGKVYETCAEKENRKFITGKDVTRSFTRGAQKSLEIAKKYNCRKAILCKWSPSCDKTGITGKLLTLHNIDIINTF